MANGNPISEVTGNLFGDLFGGAAWVLILILVIAIIGGVIYYFAVYRRKFDIMVKVISERSSDPKMFFDKGAILKDRGSGNKFFKLFNTKVELETPPFRIMESTNKGDYIELYRDSEDNFSFLTSPLISKKTMVKTNGKIYPVRKSLQRRIESDIYYILKRKEQNKKILNPETLLYKLLEHSPLIIAGFFMLIILYIFMDKLPVILNQLTELVSRLASIEGTVTKVG